MKRRVFSISILALYLVVLIKVIVLKDIPTFTIGSMQIMFAGEYEIKPGNFTPFATILPYLLGDKGPIIAGVNLLGNILPLVPLGMLLPSIWRSINWKKCLAIAIATSLSIETAQAMLRVGIFDIDDVILNSFGVMAGYVGITKLTEWVRTRNYKNIAVVAAVLAITTLALLYAVYPKGSSATLTKPQPHGVCGNTQGTGKVVRQNNSELTITRNDGTLQTMKIAERATIKNDSGTLSVSDLRAGQRVTVVVGDDETVSTILVCSE